MAFLVLLAVVMLVLPIVLSIIAISKVGSQSAEIARLKRRVSMLEPRAEKTQLEKLQEPIEVAPPPRRAPPKQAPPKSTAQPKPAPKVPVAALKSAKSPRQTQAQTPKPKAQAPRRPQKSFEERIGTQWSVWVGGFALLVGAVFLLRYTIEAGVFTPAMRMVMAALLGLALLGAGEWLHRGELGKLASGKAAALVDGISGRAYIPTLLTAIGVFTLFGTAYTAYALYGFLGPLLTFMLMGAIALGSLALSFRHGGVLAAIGLVGAMCVPLLVQTDVPNIYALYGYVLTVAAVALYVARHRDWGWLNIAALGGLLFWSMMSLEATQAAPEKFIWFAFIALSFIVSALIAERSKNTPLTGDIKSITHRPAVAAIWALIASMLVMAAAFEGREYIATIILGLGFAALVMLCAWLFRRQPLYSAIGAALGALIVVMTPQSVLSTMQILLLGGAYMAALHIFAVLRIFNGSDGDTSPAPTFWSLATIAGTLLFLFAVLGRAPNADTGLMAIAFGLCAAIFASVAILLRGEGYTSQNAARIYVVGAALAYLAAVLIGLDGIVQSLGLMMGIVIAAAAAWHFKAFMPRIIAPIFALISAAHTLTGPIRLGQVSEAIMLNSLWLYFALPCALCAGAAWALTQHKTDVWSEILKALTLTFAVLFVVFQIHHFMNDGNILAYRLSFDELALQVLTGLSFTIGATLMAPHKWNAKGDLHTRILPTLAMGVSLITLITFVLAQCLAKSPLLNAGETVSGNFLLNSLTLGYLLPGLALAYLARALKTRRPDVYIRILGALSLFAIILFVTGLIRLAFTGMEISIFADFPDGLELYAISAAWLLLGIGLLVLGLQRDNLHLRVASAILIVLTILKAFLVDMAGLEGVLRALSFVVLGVILIVIGRVYQKILFSKSNTESET